MGPPNEHLTSAVQLLRTIARRVGRAHDLAWWPSVGGPPKPGRLRMRGAGAMPEAGDSRSLDRYGELVTDLQGLESDIRQAGGVLMAMADISRKSSPEAVRSLVLLYLTAVANLAFERVEDAAARTVLKRVDRIAGHVDAILSVPNYAKLVECRNPDGRDQCTGIASNKRLRLCRSCENAQQYRRRRKRKT